ncbi:MAG TPA: substrate-binding domain-containing protein, partial [Naasia sp.]
YEQALLAAGIARDPHLVHASDFTIPGGYVAGKQVLGDPRHRPTAIVAASDEVAMGAILAARDLGLQVPHDLSIIGIDGHELAEFFGLTTVAQFPALQGRLAVEMLMGELKSGNRAALPANTPLPFELIVRSSTSRPSRAD